MTASLRQRIIIMHNAASECDTPNHTNRHSGCSGGLLQAVSSCFSGSSGDSSNGSSSMQHEAAGVGAQPLDKEAAGGTNGDQELTAPVPAECMMPQEDDGVAAGLPGIPPAPLDLPSKESWQTGPGALGQPDCTLQGSGWTLRAHTHVLRGA